MQDAQEYIYDSFLKLKKYVEDEDYKGWDPFDGLNSSLFQSTPLSNSRFFRLAWIQIFKRSPLNLRKITKVPKGYNAKGIALFLSGYCNLYTLARKDEYLQIINRLSDMLIDMRASGYSSACWGYNFDWQARAFFQPKNTPTVVATTFVTRALLQAYDITANEQVLNVTVTAAGFITNDLNQTLDDDGDVAFSYSPEDKTQVYNASLLGVRCLCDIYTYTRDRSLLEIARKAVSFACKAQREDGAWPYSPLPYHQWVDNFHTGYNLECIHRYEQVSGDLSFQDSKLKGLDYYLDHFFKASGMPKYYDNETFPVDIHAPSQFLATLYQLNLLDTQREKVEKVLSWTITNMQSQEGYFYYQKNKWATSKISYMRWSQAWMFYAYSFYFLKFGLPENNIT